MSLQDDASKGLRKQGPFWKPGPRARALGIRLLDLLLPPGHLDGEGGPAASTGLSPAVWSKITFLEDPVCDRCGSALEFPMGPGATCGLCADRKSPIARIRAATIYDEHSRELILQLKHADRTDVAPLLARWLSRAGAEVIGEAEALLPVPMHPWRLFLRRYNQAAEIARPLAKLTGKPYLADALRRRRDTQTQAGRSATGRRRNVQAAFAVPAGRRSEVAGKRLLLVDDVLTTGSTAEACARALRAAGALSVDVLVVARVKDRRTVPT